jgi:hypothetical protein
VAQAFSLKTTPRPGIPIHCGLMPSAHPVCAEGSRMRFLIGTESLTGFVLITWSASFTCLEMEQFWRRDGRGQRS